MSFDKNKYVVIKQIISKEIAELSCEYLKLKRKVFYTLRETKTISQFNEWFGRIVDTQIPETYCIYSDILMETLLTKIKKKMKQITNLDLIETYSYVRLYKKGDELKRHKDRKACEISTTLNLGGDVWPIFIEPSGDLGKKGNKIILEPGDMLIYKGSILEHWREPFEGDECIQVFLHYNNIDTQGLEYKYDKRPHLGLPYEFKKT
jgi:hypothetical protein